MTLNLPEYILNDFIDETDEILVSVDQELAELSNAPDNLEQVNKVFRLIHTLKGSASFLGFARIVDVIHYFENTLNLARKQESSITQDDIVELFKRLDITREIMTDIKSGKLSAGVTFTPPPPKEESPPDTTPQEKPAIEPVEAISDDKNDAVEPENQKPEQTPPADWTTRVKLSRLDNLSQLVGELTLRRNQLLDIATAQATATSEGDPLSLQLSATATQINRITAELQGAVLETRMTPLQSIFSRFPPLVRDIARKHGKKAWLETEGEQAEVERIAIEPLSESLTHIISNAIHHGIELPEERKALGKSEEGVIRIKAWCDGNSIVVTVSDDGSGIDTGLVAQKALANGTILAEELQRMTKEQVLHLVFTPGLSTKETAGLETGRGVGMDAVKNSITRLNGSIKIDSEPGVGTTIELRLPLTLSIIQALVVEVGLETFILPASAITETVRVDKKSIQLVDGGEIITYRNSPIPVVRLSELFDVPSMSDKWEYIAVVKVGESMFGVRVDKIKGQEDIVFKVVNDFLNGCGATGATALSNGRAAFVVNLGEIMEVLDLFEVVNKKTDLADEIISFKILLAEGSNPIRKSLAKSFGNAGYRVVEAKSGAGVLRAVMGADKPFDLILLDCKLPGMGGVPLAERLKSHPKFRGVPIVALMLPNEQIDIEHGFRIGIENFIPKNEAKSMPTIVRKYIITQENQNRH